MIIFPGYVHTGCGLYGVWSEGNKKPPSVLVKKWPAMHSVDINLKVTLCHESDAQPCRPGRPRVFHQLGGVEAEGLPIWYQIAGMIAKGRLAAGAQCGQRSEACRLHCGGTGRRVWQRGRTGTVTEARHHHALPQPYGSSGRGSKFIRARLVFLPKRRNIKKKKGQFPEGRALGRAVPRVDRRWN